MARTWMSHEDCHIIDGLDASPSLWPERGRVTRNATSLRWLERKECHKLLYWTVLAAAPVLWLSEVCELGRQ